MKRVDTLFRPMAIKVEKKDSLGICINLMATLQPEGAYVLKVDSAACKDIYGVTNDSLEVSLKLKSLEEYSSLTIKMVHYDSLARIQLLDEKDVVISEKMALPEGTKFEHLQPTTYYIRLYIDQNTDGKWTTGDWISKRQPEPIYYYPNKLKLRANWDFEENFDHLAIPQTSSKPKSLSSKDSKKRK